LAEPLVRQLINAGIHFGHRVSRWNPKMEPYIFGRRGLIHIIDIKETIRGLLRAKKFLARVVADGQDVLFVGTKRQARHAIAAHAQRVGMPYVAERWLGGTLTNFRTIRSRLSRLEELEAMERDGVLEQYSKKMVATLQREKRKISRNLQGIRTMNRLPGAVVIIDVRREHIAAREAKKLGIPTVCLIDTDSDPDYADIPIPGNDDAMRAVELIVAQLADAVEEGKRGREAAEAEATVGPQAHRRARRVTARAAEPAASQAPQQPVASVQTADPDGAGTSADQAPPSPPPEPDEPPQAGESPPPANVQQPESESRGEAS